MAAAGVDIWLIQAFCRWGSRAVLEYVRDCHSPSTTDVAAKVTKGLRLMEVREKLAPAHGRSHSRTGKSCGVRGV